MCSLQFSFLIMVFDIFTVVQGAGILFMFPFNLHLKLLP